MANSSPIQPIKVWGQGGPNPPKVAFILEELDVPYEIVPIPFSDVKKPYYLAINPNGRLPAIYDPNTKLTLWESGAIVEYLVERYDTTHQLSFAPESNESYIAKQWLFFQTSGQGPYFGQASWFKKFHAEKVPSALSRYIDEVNRISGVLEGSLAQQRAEHGDRGNGPWLVGSKMSYADLSFVSWQVIIGMILDKNEYDVDIYPSVKEWIDRMSTREKIQVVFEKAKQASMK